MGRLVHGALFAFGLFALGGCASGSSPGESGLKRQEIATGARVGSVRGVSRTTTTSFDNVQVITADSLRLSGRPSTGDAISRRLPVQRR